jgi:peptidoglycan/LPS O-acetylase OafA/YrhL
VELLVGAVSVTVWNSVARFLPWVVVAFILVIAAVALLQSFQLFRRPDGARRSLLYYPAALILGALLMGAVVGDLESLRWRNQSQHQNLTEGERR